MSRFLPVGKGVKGAAGFLLAAIPALGAVLTGLAITGGLVGHMARDHPLASYGAFGLAVLAIFAGGVAAFALREGSTEETGRNRASLSRRRPVTRLPSRSAASACARATTSSSRSSNSCERRTTPVG
jgi:hypothetical protein